MWHFESILAKAIDDVELYVGAVILSVAFKDGKSLGAHTGFLRKNGALLARESKDIRSFRVISASTIESDQLLLLKCETKYSALPFGKASILEHISIRECGTRCCKKDESNDNAHVQIRAPNSYSPDRPVSTIEIRRTCRRAIII